MGKGGESRRKERSVICYTHRIMQSRIEFAEVFCDDKKDQMKVNDYNHVLQGIFVYDKDVVNHVKACIISIPE